MSSDDYHLGTSDQELERLAYQHQAWQDVTESLLSKAGFGFGQTLLDLGCGPGYISIELARLVTSTGHVYAMDASRKFLDCLHAQAEANGLNNIHGLQGDVHQIDLPNNCVDGIFIRWLLCFVERPQDVLRECFRVLRPGGRLIVWDYFNYDAVGLFPNQETTAELFRAYRESALKNGGSYDIGNRLPEMLAKCGFDLIDLDCITRVARPGSALWHWARLFHDSYVPKLVEQGLLGQDAADRFYRDWENADSEAGAYFMPPPMLGMVAEKRAR